LRDSLAILTGRPLIPDDGIERRPVVSEADVRIARAVAATVRDLRRRFPDAHCCASYDHPLWIVVHVVAPDGMTIDEEWVAK
jgi:hypothetical protein